MNFKISENVLLETGIDAINTVRLNDFLSEKKSLSRKFYKQYNKFFRNNIKAYPYEIASKKFISPQIDNKENIYPSIIPGWDHSPRSGKEALILTDASPELFEKHVKKAVEIIKNKSDEHKIIFIKSWNEWAEGNYMEPDLRWGTKFLEALKRQIVK